MEEKEVSVHEARAMQERGAIYVDVRSTDEFADGHPAGAVNVPLFEPDEDSGEMMPNPDFVRVMKTNFGPDATLLMGCQVGGRSMRAAEILRTFGYEKVVNVRGGYGGMHDQMTGRAIEPGWVESGLPVEHTSPAGSRYADLLANADAGGT